MFGKRRRPQSSLLERATIVVSIIVLVNLGTLPSTLSVPSTAFLGTSKSHSPAAEEHAAAGRDGNQKHTLRDDFWKTTRRKLGNNNDNNYYGHAQQTAQLHNDQHYNKHEARSRGRRHHRRQLQFIPIQSGDTSEMPTFTPMQIPSIGPSLPPATAQILDFASEHVAPSLAPTRPPISQILAAREQPSPSSVVLVETPTNSERNPTPAPFQPLKFAAVPVGFDIMLKTQSQQDLGNMSFEAKQILEDHLYLRFKAGFSDEEGVMVRSVDLNVKAMLTPQPEATRPPQRRQRRLLESMKRILQLSRDITLETRGVAGFQVNRNSVDTEAFLNQVNNIINESLDPDELMSQFQNSTTGFSEFRVNGVTNTETQAEKEKDKPTLVEIIIAIILIVLMAAGLVVYLCVFLKKRRKKKKRRQQFGSKHPSPYKPNLPPRGRLPHGASVTPTGSPTRMVTIPATVGSASRPTAFHTARMNSSSSSESSYRGLDSEPDEEDPDPFAKELRLAASLDRRAWNDFQYRKEQFNDEDEDEDMMNNADGVYRELSNLELEEQRRAANSLYGLPERNKTPPGAIGLSVNGDTVSIKSSSSFPYGDEGEAPAMSLGHRVLQGLSEEAYMTNADDMELTDPAAGWRMTKSATANLNGRGANSPGRAGTPYSFLYHADRLRNGSPNSSDSAKENNTEGRNRYRDPPENFSESTSGGAVRGSPTSYSWSTNTRGGTSTLTGTAAAVRGSPHSSSLNSAQRPLSSGGTSSSPAASPGYGSGTAASVRGSPHSSSLNTVQQPLSYGGTSSPAASPAFGSTNAIAEEPPRRGSEDQSMATADIVQEVQRLSQFVKSYEKNKEDRFKREHNESAHASQQGLSPIDFTKKARTSSTQTLTPNQSRSESPERRYARGREREIHGIESTPSSDSSDIHTMESDASRRLGITPFSVEKASYQNPSPRGSPSQSPSNGTAGLYRQSASPRGSPRAGDRENGNNGSISSGSPRRLSSLRHSDAILDSPLRGSPPGPSDETDPEVQQPSKPFPFSSPVLRDPRVVVAPRKRSKNQEFNKKLSMFEALPPEPIYPPSQHWQYEH